MAGASGSAAKSAKEAKDAWEGSLAAWDEINILQQPPETPEIAEAGGGGGGGGQFVETPIDEELIAKIEAIKTKDT